MGHPVRPLLETLFRAAVEAVEPGRLVRSVLRTDGGRLLFLREKGAPPAEWPGAGRIFLVGGGKAGRAMGRAALDLMGERVAAGILAVPKGEGGREGAVAFLEAGHPIPDAGSRRAAREMLALLAAAEEDDLAVGLVSGGGSAMISLPAPGLSAEDKEAAFRILLRSGADIAEINTVRKHLSAVKGGRMAEAARSARVFALLLSDVPGDDPSVIASGPFSPDPTTFADASRILTRRGACTAVPPAVWAHVQAGVGGRLPETPKPGAPAFRRVAAGLIGSNGTALAAAARAATAAGVSVRLLPGFLRGEAGRCARAFVEEMRKAASDAAPGRPAVLVAGGETTVTVRGNGIGGRCQEFALSAAVELDGRRGMAVLCAGTDGIDGPTDAAGAVADGATSRRAEALGLSPRKHLENNDAYPFFRALGDLVVTGLTGTNVADVAIGTIASPDDADPIR
jgi:glycerate 2-kinase